MKIVQTIGFLRESSGPGHTVPALCDALRLKGCTVALHTNYSDLTARYQFPIVVHPVCRMLPRKFGISGRMKAALEKECADADIVQVNCLWMMVGVYADLARKAHGGKLVIMPRGSLSDSALRISRWPKRFFSVFVQNAVFRHADLFIATSQAELEDIRRFGVTTPIALIPNGVDVPSNEVLSWKERHLKHDKRRRLVYLSRIHPIKNVDLLIKAWGALADKFPGWDFDIVGPVQGNVYAEDMKVLASTLPCGRVTFRGELCGIEKQRFLAESDCFVLPSSSENFGLAIAEALACATPVVVSTATPWSGVEERGCGRWIDNDLTVLKNTLSEMMQMMDVERYEMGMRGREWIVQEFSWGQISAKVKLAYNWLLNPRQNIMPEFVNVC